MTGAIWTGAVMGVLMGCVIGLTIAGRTNEPLRALQNSVDELNANIIEYDRAVRSINEMLD